MLGPPTVGFWGKKLATCEQKTFLLKKKKKKGRKGIEQSVCRF